MSKKNCLQMTFATTLLALMTFCFFSCGSDDESSSSNGSSSKNRRKLSELSLKFDYPDDVKNSIPTVEHKYTIEYDAKGRLSRIERNNSSKSEDWSSEIISGIDIDYDFGLITISDKDLSKYNGKVSHETNENIHISFDLNEKGYVSHLGDYTCHYDEDGYLTRVNQEGAIWSFAYSDGDLTKFMLKVLASEPKIYYIFYGDNFNSGTLQFNVKMPEELYSYYSWIDIYRLKFDVFSRANFVVALIAYQAGLFGRTAKHTSYIYAPSTEKAIVSFKNEKDPEHYITTECSFSFK